MKKEPIKLFKKDELEGNIIRLQSQLQVGKNTADFILDNGVLKHYTHGKTGFGFYEYNEPYIIVDSIKQMELQPL